MRQLEILRPLAPALRDRRAFALLLPLLLAACAPGTKTPGWSFAPSEPPPPAQENIYPTPPEELGDRYVWEAGHWHVDGKNYTWVPGQFVERPHDGGSWVGGHWIYTGTNQWIWMPGHWRKE